MPAGGFIELNEEMHSQDISVEASATYRLRANYRIQCIVGGNGQFKMGVVSGVDVFTLDIFGAAPEQILSGSVNATFVPGNTTIAIRAWIGGDFNGTEMIIDIDNISLRKVS